MISKDKAPPKVGDKVEVLTDMDGEEVWERAQITHFDPVSGEVAVEYEDSEVADGIDWAKYCRIAQGRRQLVLDKKSGEISIERITLFEPLGTPSNEVPRVWVRGLIEQAPWYRVLHVALDDPQRLELFFPPDTHYGLPGQIVLEIPANRTPLSRWSLLGDLNRQVGTYVLRASTIMTPAQVAEVELRYASS
jgi:hypothetical protein